MKDLIARLLFSPKSLSVKSSTDLNGSFLLMSNARAGSSYLQSSLSALGAIGDFEFALRPYNPPMPHQRFLSSGIDDIASEIRNSTRIGHAIHGSKLTLPIYDYLSQEEINQLIYSCKNIHRPIHLVRHYWDLLKSNLSRGVAHDFVRDGKGWSNTSEMHKVYSKLPSSELGPGKPSVFVALSEGEFKSYLMNLIRNDFAFASIREAANGITVVYESLTEIDSFKRMLKFLKVNLVDVDVKHVVANPILKKLPIIPDSNIPHETLLRNVTESCYQYYTNLEAAKLSAKQIFTAQVSDIKRIFG